MNRRQLGNSDLFVSPIALGCWPIAGMTSLNVTEKESLATIREALELDINFFDTAFCYGANGESEKLIAEAIGKQRDQAILATKCGIHWDNKGKRVVDGRAATLKNECEESLRRLNTDHVDLLYLHAPDPSTSLEDSATALRELQQAGKTRYVGLSNVSVKQLECFSAICPVMVCQLHYNMVQREIEQDRLPWCQKHGVSLAVYWPLMKGLLAGKLPRDHRFAPGDGRAKYPIFQGEQWQKNQDLLDELRPIAQEAGHSLAQTVLNWTIHRPGITSVLCGAKRPDQIRENAGGMGWRLDKNQLQRIDQALKKRGTPESRAAV